MQVYLETERLVLRRFTEDDVDNLFDLDSDPDVMRFLTGGAPTTREAIQTRFLPAFRRYYEHSEGFGFWAAIEKSTGDFLGWFHFRPPEGSSPDEPELGYRLRKSAWGKGYGTEGSRALIRKGFTELGVRRVIASTYQDNIGSRRVMEKVGMTLVRTFRMTAEEMSAMGYDVVPDDLWDGDDVEYALEKADWERQEADRSEEK
jgi:RimJ/RimL family protein N-acetyltransferase